MTPAKRRAAVGLRPCCACVIACRRERRKRRGAIRVLDARGSELVGVRVGIVRFCAEIGVEPSDLLGIEGACVSTWDLAGELQEECALPPDEVLAEQLQKELSRIWGVAVPPEPHPLGAIMIRELAKNGL